jgi:hypothetical protein
MEELRRVAESRIETALHIDHRDPRDFAIDVQDQQQTLWPWGTDEENYSKEAILNIMGAILTGYYKYSTGPTIRQLALHQLDKDMVSDTQCEDTWQWWYQHRHMDLVLDGKEYSEEAEMLNIMIDTLDLYRRHGVFQYDHYCPWKAQGADGRLLQPMQENFASSGNRRLRRKVSDPYCSGHVRNLKLTCNKERFVSEQHNWPQPITLF